MSIALLEYASHHWNILSTWNCDKNRPERFCTLFLWAISENMLCPWCELSNHSWISGVIDVWHRGQLCSYPLDWLPDSFLSLIVSLRAAPGPHRGVVGKDGLHRTPKGHQWILGRDRPQWPLKEGAAVLFNKGIWVRVVCKSEEILNHRTSPQCPRKPWEYRVYTIGLSTQPWGAPVATLKTEE